MTPRRSTRTTKKPSLFSQLTGNTTTRTAKPRRTAGTTTTTTTTRTTKTTGGRAAPATHHRRKTSVGDKVSGALTKLNGTLTRRTGKKAAGSRRMHGTDGRGSRRTVV